MIYPLNTSLSLKTTSTWHDFGEHHQPSTKQVEKCILTELLSFRCKKAYLLKKIILHWTGEPLSNLSATLYKKRNKENLLLVEKNLVSDGIWDEHKQEITFPMNEKIVSLTTYYLVLNIPFKYEKILKNGTFLLPTNKIEKN